MARPCNKNPERGKDMGIFKEMYEGRHFESIRDYAELRRIAFRRYFEGMCVTGTGNETDSVLA
jgi:hypothetical protein